MSIRSLLPVALLVAGALTAGPASAQSPTDRPVPGVQPGACIDHLSPTSGFTRKAARRAGRYRLLRGVARDVGCGVDRVAISVQHKRGRTVETLFGKARLRKLRRGRQHWFVVRGTTHWSFRLSKRLPRGTYLVRTRAIDFAGNVEKPRVRRLRLR